MADAELATLDAHAQAERVARGEVKPLELIDAAIERLERLDVKLNAVIHRGFERARERAQDPDLAGPFRGVPFLMKDIGGDEAGEPLHCGMGFLKQAGWRASADAYFTQRTRAAGLVSLGRTNTPELALLPTTEPVAYGPTRNPWSLDHSSGGSSGGASAAVAAGIVPVAHASDGGGSIRGPASMCALVGLKPTRGRCSFGPGLGERWSGFSCEFVLSRSVRDSAALLDALSGPMPGDPYFAPPPPRPFAADLDAGPGRLRVGLMTSGPRGLQVDAESAAAATTMARVLEGLGHIVEPAYPDALDDPAVVFTYVKIVAANVARALDAWGEKVGRPVTDADVEPLTWALAENGRATSAPELIEAIEFVHRLGRRFAAWWSPYGGRGFDLLLTPTQGAPPPELGTLGSTPENPFEGFGRSAPFGAYTLPFNLSGQPAISLPAHWTSAGLPCGAQLVAPYAREDLLLRVAAQVERAAPWADRRPTLFG